MLSAAFLKDTKQDRLGKFQQSALLIIFPIIFEIGSCWQAKGKDEARGRNLCRGTNRAVYG